MLVDEDLRTGDDLPHSIAYTINGEPGDFCACSKGMYAYVGLLNSRIPCLTILLIIQKKMICALQSYKCCRNIISLDGYLRQDLSSSCSQRSCERRTLLCNCPTQPHSCRDGWALYQTNCNELHHHKPGANNGYYTHNKSISWALLHGCSTILEPRSLCSKFRSRQCHRNPPI
jgi:hypothetical protein